MMGSIARSFKLKMTLVLENSPILIDEHWCGAQCLTNIISSFENVDYKKLGEKKVCKIIQHAKFEESTVKPVKNNHFQKDRKIIFKTNYHLMQVKYIAECSKGSILQCF